MMTVISNEIKAAIYKDLGIPERPGVEKYKYIDIKPARGYAYLSPARKNAHGEIVMKAVDPSVRIMMIFIMVISVAVYLTTRNPLVLLILLGEMGVLAAYEWITRNEKVIVTQDKIQLKEIDHYWKDYTGAYIASWSEGKRTYIWLILMMPDNTRVQIDLFGTINASKLGTAIRDMEPASWKE